MRASVGLAGVLALFALAACQTSVEPTTQDLVADGQAIAEANCASCHAIGAAGASPRTDAPPFREIGERYHFPVLEEELTAGIGVGHPPMPHFQFTPRGTDALLAYMRHVQETGREDEDGADQ